MLALFQHPEQLNMLKAQPELIPTAVEELLRYDGPAERALPRFAAEDVTIGGQTIRRGDRVIVVLASGDHDPAQYACPHKLDITREQNPHMAFSFGAHYCVGAALARMEVEIAVNTLLKRLPNIQIQVPVSELKWKPSAHERGLVAMPVMWDR